MVTEKQITNWVYEYIKYGTRPPEKYMDKVEGYMNKNKALITTWHEEAQGHQ